MVGIRGKARLKARDGEFIDLRRGKGHYAGKEVVPYVLGRLLCSLCRHAVCNDVSDTGKQSADYHGDAPEDYARKLLVGNDVVEYVAHYVRYDKLYKRARGLDDKGESDVPLVGLQVFYQ